VQTCHAVTYCFSMFVCCGKFSQISQNTIRILQKFSATVIPECTFISVRGSNRQYCFCQSFFVSTITHEPLRSAWWNFACTCNSKTSRTLLNFKARCFFCVFLCAWCCGYLRTLLSLEQGLMILFIWEEFTKQLLYDNACTYLNKVKMMIKSQHLR